jgi:alkylation response protein AidB-like acyl-CoA dehydrogenase
MNFGFTEDQDMIRKSARDFVVGESSLERVREMHTNEVGYSKELWQQIADNGWLGAVFPEEYGGIGLSYSDFICIAEEFGRGMMPEPLTTVSTLAGNAILFGGTEEQKQEMLPALIEGASLITLGAYETSGRYDPAHVTTTAAADGDSYTLNGAKNFVPNAQNSDTILVTARTSGGTTDEDGISLFAVTPGEGVEIQTIETWDHHPRAHVTLTNAKATLIGEAGSAFLHVDRAIDCATVALCAEMVGGIDEALRMTVEYAQERVQFDRLIGSFQAVKHKCANMYTTMEMTRSAMYYAALAIDEDRDDRRKAISTAKALCSQGYLAASKEAIQLHGGIGYTDEHTIQFFYKRALTSSATFGDATWHKERYAVEIGL